MKGDPYYNVMLWVYRFFLVLMTLVACLAVVQEINEFGRRRYVVREQVSQSDGRYEYDMYCRIEGRFKTVDMYLGHYVAVGASDVPDRVEWSQCQ